MQPRTIGILIFDGVELLDFAGPYEVFSAARETVDSRERPLTVFTVAESSEPVMCNNGLIVQPRHTLSDCPALDILLVPGGRGTRTAIERAPLILWIAERAQSAELTTSVCTGSFLLAKAALLHGKAATTHWGSVARLRQAFPDIEVRDDVRWVDEGNIVTSAGVSAGIDMSLHLLRRLYGEEAANATARGMEYEHWIHVEDGQNNLIPDN